MTTFRVPGQRDELLVGKAPRLARFLTEAGATIEVRDAVRIDVSRAAAAEPLVVRDVADDDVILLELDGGVRMFLRADQLETELGAQVSRGGSGELVLPTSISLGGDQSRGWGSLGLRVLHVLGIDAASVALKPLIWGIEKQLEPGPGLYRWRGGNELESAPIAREDIPTDEPVLVLIHGTASRTMGSFGELGRRGSRSTWNKFWKRFGKHVYGFEHHTLSQSPIENARDLLKSLPAGMQQLHLLTHSRGGLVGELVCRGRTDQPVPFDSDVDLGLFAGDEYEQHRDALAELSELFGAGPPQVTRFVRAGCPALGTTLASGRLDRWFSNLVTLVGTVTGLGDHPLYDFASCLATAIVHKKADPTDLPGLSAQMPGSPLVRMLNRGDIQVDADLTVLAGDIDGGGVLSQLGVFVADQFYPGPHDLVVDTEAMYGGGPRVRPPVGFLDKGPDVNHFRYFSNRDTVRRLARRLTAEKLEDSRAEFEEFAQQETIPAGRAVGVSGTRGAPAGARPLVFLLPGIMGSHLSLDGNRVWLHLRRLAFGRFAKLKIDATGVTAESVMASSYGKLRKFLLQTHDVETFPFDWRRPLEEAADRLADDVRQALADTGDQPVRLLAHSMGGLVARTMIALHPELWDAVCKRDGRLVMLGTPNRGSYTVPAVLLGEEAIVKYIALADLRNDKQDLMKVIARFTGLLGMLPWDDTNDLFLRGTWNRLRDAIKADFSLPRTADLKAALRLRRLLEKPAKCPERMVYVAGQAEETPARIDVRDGKADLRGSKRGDGRVLWSHGTLEGVDTYFAPDVVHGDLPKTKRLFNPILDLLVRGETRRLTQGLPAGERGADGEVEEFFEMRETPLRAFPDAAAMERAALGQFGSTAEPEQESVKVRVVHGDLAFADHPVVVGHYAGDTLVSAEKWLDRQLSNRLSDRRRLGTYAGPLDSSIVVRHPKDHELAAVVIGLGKVGGLGAGNLAETFAKGCLRYAKAVDESPIQADDDRPRKASLSVLLIGSGEGGLGVENAIRALLQGVILAREALTETKLDQRVRFDCVEFIELYDDRAVQAATALLACKDDRRFQENFEFAESLHEGTGGRRQVSYREDAAWWMRMQIRQRAHVPGALEFVPLTDRARAEIVPLHTQRKLLEQFADLAANERGWDNRHAVTLFELLVPNQLKGSAHERDVMLVLDDVTAAFPWELLQPRDSRREEPISVQVGMLRQLMTEDYRERVVTPVRNTALVIGDPPSNFPPLPGAEAEARWVATRLGTRGFEVEACVGTGVTETLNELFGRPLKVLHAAAHGALDYGDQKLAGMVIGDDTLLTPGDLQQLSQVPELVFLNCCYLGKHVSQPSPNSNPNPHPHRLAANLATQLIRMGVRAVVAAGWAVDDTAALLFAQEFYDRLLAGATFGTAVKRAREQTYFAHGSRVNTWGAYQCYGDPDYRLVTDREEGGDGWQQSYVAPWQAAHEALNLAELAKTTPSGDREWIRESAERLLTEVDTRWSGNGEARAALGAVFGNLRDYDRAMEQYTAALACEDGAADLRSAEQLASLRGRSGAKLVKSVAGVKPAESAEIRDEGLARIAQATQELERILQFGRTTERLSLLGAAHKRLLQSSPAARRNRKALREMTQAYQDAADARTGAVAYPLTNALTGTLLQAMRGARKLPDDFEEQLDALIADMGARDRSFWNDVSAIDAEVLACMACEFRGGRRETALKDLGERYAHVTRGRASDLAFDSVVNQFDFLLLMVKGKPERSAWKQVIADLRTLRGKVRAIAL